MRSPADVFARRSDRQDPTGHRPDTAARRAAERGWRMRTTGRGGGPRNRRSRLASRPLQP